MEDEFPSEPIQGGFRSILPIPPTPPGFTYHLYRSPGQLLKPAANKLLRLRRQIPPLYQDLVSDGAITMGSSDAEFICKGGEIAKAHKVILSLTSQFFCDLFRKQKPNKISYVSVPDIECKTMKSILHLCYKRDVSLSNEQDVLSVMSWVEEFGINRSSLYSGLIHGKSSPSTSQHCDSKSDSSNRPSTPQKRRSMPALVKCNGIKGAQNLKSYRAAATRRLYRTVPRVPAECLESAEKADEQERIRWLYACQKCSISLDSSIKAYAHYLKCSPEKKCEDSIIKYRQGYYGQYQCPLCPRKYTTIYGFLVHCNHNHSEYKKLLRHVISEDKLMCINCGNKFDGPTDFHQHLQNEMICSKPPKEKLRKRKYKKIRRLDHSSSK